MAIFTAIASAVVAAAGLTAGTLIASVVFWTTYLVAVIATSMLINKLAGRPSLSGGSGGGRQQLPPATDNKIPVVYGKAFVSGPVIDAKISTDNKIMWYVVALAEHTDTTAGSAYTYGKIYYDGKQVNFGSVGAVASLTTNTTPAQTDSKVNGKLYIWLFTNGSYSGTNTGGQSAIDLLSVAQIPPAARWTNNHLMTNCAFIVAKVIFDADAGTVRLGGLQAELTNNVTKPGTVIKDYMINTRYGCAIPQTRIDLDSLTSLNDYSDELITYTNANGIGTSTQVRYRINGPIDTAKNCLDNLQLMADSCDSWLQYSELTAKWRVVVNKPFTTSTSSLFLVNSSNLIGGLDLAPIDLNSTYNEVEVSYPNTNIKDQTDFQIVTLATYQPGLLSPNEAVNRLNAQLPLVNNAVQAKYIAVRQLLQSREDLTISFKLDYSGIQIEAGDVIRVTHEAYGWTAKLFRVSNVQEEKTADGNLGVSITAFEYNGTIYDDQAIQDFIPEFNTGLNDPNVINIPDAPTITTNTATTSSVASFIVQGIVPAEGSILYMDFNYGTTSTVVDHLRYRTISQGQALPYSSGTAVNIVVNDLAKGDYYWSVTARNNQAGRQSTASTIYSWPGPSVSPYNTVTNTGGIGAGYLAPGAVTSGTIASFAVVDGTIGPGAVTTVTIAVNAVTTSAIAANAIIADKIAAGAVIASKLDVGTLSAITATMGTLTSGNIIISTSTISTSTRLEISSVGHWPLWYGSGIKSNDNAKFYLDVDGNAVFSGSLGAAGGVLNFDAIAGGNTSTTAGILKGLKYVECRDGIPVVFDPPYPQGFDNRITVIFLSGGLTYSPSLGTNSDQYQILEAENLTVTGFTPYLKLAENNTGTLSTTTLAFSAGMSPTVTKTGAANAYDDTYTAGFRITIIPESFNGFGQFAYVNVNLEGKFASTSTWQILNTVSLSNSTNNGTIFGKLINAGANAEFRLTYDEIYGFVSNFTGTNLTYTVSDTGTTVISATPNGVPAVVALAFLE